MRENQIKIENLILHNGYMLCEKVVVENKTEAGIYLGDTFQGKDNAEAANLFKILKIDEKKDLSEGIKIEVEVGDYVTINSGHKTFIAGKEFLMIKQGNIVYSIKGVTK